MARSERRPGGFLGPQGGAAPARIAVTVQADADTPPLWVLREDLGLTGTKFGCGMALCGAGTVHLDGAPVRSCSTPLSAARGKRITTIEGLPKAGRLHSVQAAWIVPGMLTAVIARPNFLTARDAIS